MSVFKPSTIAAIALLALGSQSVTFAEVGYNEVTCDPSKTVVIQDAWVGDADVEATVVGTSGGDTVTVAGGTLQDDKYNNGLYYVVFASGAAEGRWSTITTNDTDQFTLENTDLIGSIQAGDDFTIFQHALLGDLMPAGLEGVSFVASDIQETGFGTSIDVRRTTVLLYAPNVLATAGINKATSNAYFFADGFWRSTGTPTVNANNTILRPDQYLLVRNENHTEALTIIPEGKLPRQPLAVEVDNAQLSDLPVSTAVPVRMTLSDLNLGGTAAFVDETITDTGFGASLDQVGDQVLVFTDPDNGFDPATSQSFVYVDGHWRNTAAPTVFEDDFELLPGVGVIVRKRGNGSGTETWVNRPDY